MVPILESTNYKLQTWCKKLYEKDHRTVTLTFTAADMFVNREAHGAAYLLQSATRGYDGACSLARDCSELCIVFFNIRYINLIMSFENTSVEKYFDRTHPSSHL